MVKLLHKRLPKASNLIFFVVSESDLGGKNERFEWLKLCAIILNLLSKSRFFEVKLYCKKHGFFGNFLDKIHKNSRNYIKLYCIFNLLCDNKFKFFRKICHFLVFFVQKSKKFYGFIFFYAKNQKFQKKNKNFMDLWIWTKNRFLTSLSEVTRCLIS